MNVRYCCEQFLLKQGSSLKPGTIATYQSCFRVHLFDAFDDRLVDDITLGEWIDFFDEKSKALCIGGFGKFVKVYECQ